MESSTTSPDPFSLRNAAMTTAPPATAAIVCPVNYIQFPIANAGNSDMRCSGVLGAVSGDATPAAIPCETSIIVFTYR